MKSGIEGFNASFILIFFIVFFFFSTLVSNNENESFYSAANLLLKKNLLISGVLSVILHFSTWFEISRLVLLGMLAGGFFVELLYAFIVSKSTNNKEINPVLEFSIVTLIIEFFILIWIMVYIIIDKEIMLRFDQDLSIYFSLSIIGVWLINGLFTHQFTDIESYSNFWRLLWIHIKSYLFFGILVSIIVFILQFDKDISGEIIYGVVLYSLWSICVFVLIFVYQKPTKTDEINNKLFGVSEFIEYDLKKLKSSMEYPDIYNPDFSNGKNNDLLANQLEDIYLKSFSEVFDFVKSSLQLDSFDISKCSVLRSSDTFNIEVLPNRALQLYMNLHQINDMRRLNSYIIAINEKLMDGGVFVSKIETNKFRKIRFLNNYPVYLAYLFYLGDFLWRRVIPKMPVIKKFYFVLTKGRNRAISMAEGLGRLYYCGFEVFQMKEIDNFLYFIAVKKRSPSNDTNPSYGPLIKMKRIGQNKEIIDVYKFRTMHPYSEYLQEFVYKQLALEDGGKFKDDFRITYWGKIYRKLWIDELPMLINFIKGELKLVGIRPLSRQYFSLYPDDLQEKRVKYKPGLIPPFYVDLPVTLNDIIESEHKYLDEYERNPIITDFRYFVLSIYNILIKKKRSG